MATDFRANEPRQGYDRTDESVFRTEVERTVQILSERIANILAALPTVDPLVAGDLWNDDGTLRVSAGP